MRSDAPGVEKKKLADLAKGGLCVCVRDQEAQFLVPHRTRRGELSNFPARL